MVQLTVATVCVVGVSEAVSIQTPRHEATENDHKRLQRHIRSNYVKNDWKWQGI